MKTRFVIPVIIFLSIVFFFQSFFLKGLLPIPSDLVVGLFHPFRDSYAKDFPRGVPFKNPLLTDPVTQQLPWRDLALDELKSGSLPLWNPYQMAGYPLLGNVQSAPFYPLNLLLMIMPLSMGWSLLIISQPLLALIFMYLYLRQIGLRRESGLFGSITFAFGGFMVSWLEWGTIGSTALWLPLMLYAVTKIVEKKEILRSLSLLSVAIVCSYLAGHTQTFFYEMILLISYILVFSLKKSKSNFSIFSLFSSIVVSLLLLSPLIWIQFQFIFLSARTIDLNWHIDGWFIPWQNLIQFIVPNFFGNPATGNYWGVWNYGEFLGYVGILPLIFSLLAIIITRKKYVLFFAATALASLLFALPTLIAKIPFQLNLPFISSSQPTRLLFITDFSLAVLAGFGLEAFSRINKKSVILPGFFILCLVGIAIFLYSTGTGDPVHANNTSIALRNMVFPGVFMTISLGIFLLCLFFHKARNLMPGFVIIITLIDLFLVMQKFTPFTKKEYFYPDVQALKYLKDNAGINRVMSLDRRILSPNIATFYRLQTIEGYDPLYLMKYGQLLAASRRGKADISQPFGFSRILTTEKYDTPIINLLGVKYVLSLSEMNDPDLLKVYQQGETRVYQNKNALARTFFAESVTKAIGDQDAISFIFKNKDLSKNVVVQSDEKLDSFYSQGFIEILSYLPNNIELKTSNKGEGFLVLTDNYYPTWRVFIDGKVAKIHRVDFTFRGVVVPKGEHHVEFINTSLAK